MLAAMMAEDGLIFLVYVTTDTISAWLIVEKHCSIFLVVFGGLGGVNQFFLRFIPENVIVRGSLNVFHRGERGGRGDFLLNSPRTLRFNQLLTITIYPRKSFRQEGWPVWAGAGLARFLGR